jgi:hypothetical protein
MANTLNIINSGGYADWSDEEDARDEVLEDRLLQYRLKPRAAIRDADIARIMRKDKYELLSAARICELEGLIKMDQSYGENWRIHYISGEAVGFLNNGGFTRRYKEHLAALNEQKRRDERLHTN